MKQAFVLACMMITGVSHADKPTIADLAWIAGCWQSGTADYIVREHWMSPSGQAMVGMSHTVANEKTVAYEFLRIHEEGDGIYYTSNPSGQAQNSFKLVKLNHGEAIFEDPEHDFPQRIIYRLGKDGELMASIEGTSKGALKQVEFPFRKVQCE